MIERIHLAIIRAVNEHGSLTAAANHLHLTQSALSHAIRKLENQLGVAVWHREGRSLRLTQSGEYLLAMANRLVPQFLDAEDRLREFSLGERGQLRIGMECHPCYQWLLKVVSPYMQQWPDVDIDVRQKFQFGGIGALFSHEIDMLVTPDPFYKIGLHFAPVFDYEQVLVVGRNHLLSGLDHVEPSHLASETLVTYPVSIERLDIYSQFLLPAGLAPRRHKEIETTDIMLQMVACGRGVAALPRWLVDENAAQFDVVPVRLGQQGIHKQIHLGVRDSDLSIGYLKAFMTLAEKYTLTA
ncbi:LysR family transcriptional regulator [Neopusillimonas maritima]|uniref:HTH-type transcriptional regulator MetR n=1 Tax=Neopusillimonas maritima TaxID=2026239 RepID=A0A3A1YSG9_9BURK|nr:LysR family transcriptional regulator [Neopusillimonas maritima]RIY40585.1 LysR family transcriptional regulator [Neopusillimonas maritima]